LLYFIKIRGGSQPFVQLPTGIIGDYLTANNKLPKCYTPVPEEGNGRKEEQEEVDTYLGEGAVKIERLRLIYLHW
jgi:hypothetical protein